MKWNNVYPPTQSVTNPSNQKGANAFTNNIKEGPLESLQDRTKNLRGLGCR